MAAAAAIESLNFPEEKKRFIVETLDPLLEQMVQEVLYELPSNPTDYMISWLRRRHGGPVRQTVGLREKNVNLKRELAKMQEFIAGTVATGPKEKRAPAADSDEEEEDDDIEEPMPPPPSTRGPRSSVSAEAYGTWNKAKPFTPPQHPKSEAQKAKLQQILTSSFMFSSLEEKDLEVVLLAMVPRTFKAGSRIITEGEDGNHLYVIEKGAPVCKKKVGGQEKVVKKCAPGDVFGELALLYNTPRAATVEAVDECGCWELDRKTFSHIVKDAATKKTRQHEQFIQKVSLFSSMDGYERSQLCDALRVETATKGQRVVREGDNGDRFFIVEEGRLVAQKGASTVMEYRSGDYFGELALLRNQPRAASVVVTTDSARLLSLDRKGFVKLLGPLEEILSRKSKEYA